MAPRGGREGERGAKKRRKVGNRRQSSFRSDDGNSSVSVRAMNDSLALHAKRKQLSAAVEVFETLLAQNRANSHTYAIMINACVQCSNVAKAESVFEEMKRSKMASVQALTSMCRGLASSADTIDRAAFVLYAARELKPSVELNVRSFNTYLRGCLMHGRVNAAVDAFRSMKKTWGVSPDGSSSQYVISLLSNALRIKEARVVSQQHGAPEAVNLVSICKGAALSCNFAEFDRMSKLAGKCIVKEKEAATKTSGMQVREHGAGKTQDAKGGKRAWKCTDSQRARAANLFAAHRLTELESELASMRSWRGRVGSVEEARRAVVSALARVLVFSRCGENKDREEVMKSLRATLAESFGLAHFCKEHNEEVGVVHTHNRALDENSSKINFSSFLFRQSCKAVKLEICSGEGEWAAYQASADAPGVLWATLELRQNRVHQTFSRMVFGDVDNLVAIGGDARHVLAQRIPLNSVDRIFINHPEPPQQTSSSQHSSEAAHLLDVPFFESMASVLATGGTIAITSDNRWYSEMLVHIAAQVASRAGLECVHLADLPVRCEHRGIKLYVGVPGEACGAPAKGGSSYFDRLFKSGLAKNASCVERYMICLSKSGTC